MTDSVRVLVVINALGEGGTERSIADVVQELEGDGFRFTVALLRSRGEEGVEPRLRAAGIDVRLLPGGRDRIGSYRQLVRGVRPVLVHSMLYEANMLTRLGGIGLRVPLLTSLVNTSYSKARLDTVGTRRRKVRAVQAVDALTGRLFVDRFHAVSEAVRRDAERNLRISPSRITVVPRGRPDPRDAVDGRARDRVRHELGFPSDALVAVAVGRHELQKDHVTLLAAFAPLLAARGDLRLVIAGREGVATETIHHRLAAMPHSSRVAVLGHRPDVPELLAASDLFVMTSRYEGLPGAVIEAMASGLPVVASDIDPVHEVVEAGRSALLAPVGDPAGFARAVECLLDDADLREGLGQRGRGIYEARFTISAAARGMADLYRRTVGDAGTSAP